MNEIIVALDSFKGCLSSADACHAAAMGIRAALPDAVVTELPVSDGGEGLTSVLTHALQGQYVSVDVHDPLMRPVSVQYGIAPGDVAIMEMAAACGLPLLSATERNPEATTTFGFGEMICDALRRGCKRFILGIGGSATTDAGLGMMQALGATFKMSDGVVITRADAVTHHRAICGRDLLQIADIGTSSLLPELSDAAFMVACDVQNPLYGDDGAAYVFAPQKGADAEMVRRLDEGLRNIAEGRTMPGDGAAGGLGYALRHFLQADMRPGIDLVLQQLDFDHKISHASLILTGEGKSDRQTLMGKVPYGILQRARQQNIPVHLLAGAIEDREILLQKGFCSCNCINDGDDAPLQVLMLPQVAQRHLADAAASVARSESTGASAAHHSN